MQVGLPPLQGDYLPHGRWACTPTDIETAFVTGHGPERAAIWRDWLKALALLKHLVGSVPAAWLGGSFFTSKPVPGDIDSVFIVDADEIQTARRVLSPPDAQILCELGCGGIKASLGLNLDSFILEWEPTPTAGRTSSPDYYGNRGYWDDLWVRARDSDTRLESIPRRGYVEVIIDGYK